MVMAYSRRGPLLAQATIRPRAAGDRVGKGRARGSEGMSPLMKACRTGVMAANTMAHIANNARATEKRDTKPMHARAATLTTVPRSRNDVRRTHPRPTYRTR